MHNNPRVTNFVSTTKDENNSLRIISEMRENQNLTVHCILCKFLQCNIIKDEPQLVQMLFEDHINLISQMIQWMLVPKTIAKKKKMKSNLDFFPFRCKQFMRDNIPFYEQLYLSVRSNRLSINIWFNFLRKEYFDRETIYTSLGYFAEVMIPFAKYEFAASLNLTMSFELNKFSEKTETLSIMKILAPELIEQLILYTPYQPIFQFLKTAILVSIQDPTDYQISKVTMMKMMQSAQIENLFQKINLANNVSSQQNCESLQLKVDLLENIANSLKQLKENIQQGSDMQLRIQYLIIIILESNTINYVIDEIAKSRFCQINNKEEIQSNSVLSQSQQYGLNQSSPKIVSLSSSLNIKNATYKSPSLNSYEPEQEDLMQILLRILIHSVQIFMKIPKNCPLVKITTNEIDLKSMRETHYRNLLHKFHDQMQNMLTSLEIICRVVFSECQNSASRFIPFSSGQKIKPIGFMKFHYIKLIQRCLEMYQAKDGSENNAEKGTCPQSKTTIKRANSIVCSSFELNFEKNKFISIIQKYLSENRWNNICHHSLEKICHSLILCSYDYLRKNIQKERNKKQSETFLAFLIENFTQRDYIFLDTFKFTTQGNLQSIYNISKDLAFTLNSTNQLVILLNQFQPWKKFLMTDLKTYEEKTYPKGTKPDFDIDQQQNAYNEVTGLKVDEADTIKKLIENISQAKKWPTKILKSKGNSKSGILTLGKRKSDEGESNEGESLTRSHGLYIPHRKESKLKLEYLLKKNQEQSIEIDGITSQKQAFNMYSSLLNEKRRETTKSQIKDEGHERESQTESKHHPSIFGGKKQLGKTL